MTQDAFVTNEMRESIGLECGPFVFEIGKEPIRRWAKAIDDPNPLYHDEEYAKAHTGLVMLPSQK